MPTAEKKLVTKKVVKKVSTKKTSKAVKNKIAKTLVYAEDSCSFWVCDGQILNSLKALHDSFLKMDKDVYFHHVSSAKNDFADWVEVVLADGACAADLRKAKTATSAVTVVTKHLKTYSI